MSAATEPFRCGWLAPDLAAQVRQVVERAGATLADAIAAWPPAGVCAALHAIAGPTAYDYLPDQVTTVFADIGSRHGAAALGLYKKLVVALMLRDMEARLAGLGVTAEIAALYPGTVEFLAGDLVSSDDAAYLATAEELVRELRLVGLRSLPCGGGFIVDRRALLPKTIYRYRGWRENLRRLWFVSTRLRGLAPLYRLHIEVRAMRRFSEASHEAVHLRVAALMRGDPEVLGLVAGSWLLDPQLDWVSPHLTALRRLRVDNGALLIRDGVGEVHTARAIATSKTRRRLYEEGRYVPACYTNLWARRDLLRWADRTGGAGAA